VPDRPESVLDRLGNLGGCALDRPAVPPAEDSAAALLAVLDAMDAAVVAVYAGSRAIVANTAARRLYRLPDHRPAILDDLVQRVELHRAPAGERFAVDDLPLVRALAGVQIEAQAVLLPADHVDPAGAGRPRAGRRLTLRAVPIRGSHSHVVGAVCTAQDLTELHTEHALLTRRAAELHAINRATQAILKEEDARTAVCEAVREVTGAAIAALFEPDGRGDLVRTARVGPEPRDDRESRDDRKPRDDREPIERHPIGAGSIVAEVFSTGSARTWPDPDRVPDRVPDRDPDGANDLAGDRGGELTGVRLRTAAWLPVTSGSRCIAVLAVGSQSAAPIEEHLPVLEVLAGETAVAIERQDLLRRLRLEASSDALTGAANRRAWEQELPRALAGARPTGAPVSVVMLDLDHFKRYNDTFGHPAGDALLRETVLAWRQRLRASDLLFRYGGEEFVLLLAGCCLAEALLVAEQLRAAVPQRQTCSAGVAGWDGRESAGRLLERADAALYQAKLAGRNRVQVDNYRPEAAGRSA
jgi:diguanylate cyclase (GGDEF)-like protein